MALVHVHGIGNRGAEDEAQAELRNSWFRLELMPAAGCRSPEAPIFNPRWGAELSPPAWNWASLGLGGIESLGDDRSVVDDSIAEVVDGVMATAPDIAEGRVLVTAARTSLLWAVELLAASVEAQSPEERDATVAFCARAVSYWAWKTSDGRRGDGIKFFGWLGKIEVDDDFLDCLEQELEAIHDELAQPAKSLHKIAEAMPGFGILAAVLGIVMAMNQVAEGAGSGEIAVMVAAAMVGTFIGIFFCYAVLDPLANMMKQLVNEELAALESVKVVLVTHVSGKPALLAIDAGRRLVQLNIKPSFAVLENWIDKMENPGDAEAQPRRRATDT